jgi:hypothetical protein
MQVIVAYAAGVATGWVARSAFGSLREVAVGAVATGLDVSERLRRVLATEREIIEDLFAEARSMVETNRARLRRPSPRVVA